jgi:molybdopterin-guanine dinucleotide biosynthesis protein A
MSRPSAIILAGGRSRRFGRDKAGAELLGSPLLQHVVERLAGVCDEIIVVTRKRQRLMPLDDRRFRVVEDLYAEVGPLGGLCTGLTAASTPQALCVACDMPLLQVPLLAELSRLGASHRAVVPVYQGLTQPLCASYSKACVALLEEEIKAGNYRLQQVVDLLSPVYLQPIQWQPFDPDGLSFFNVNRAEDLERAAAIIRAGNDGSEVR